MWIISWFSAALGLKKFAGTATLVAGIVVVFSTATAWLRDDALKDCNAAWELKLVKESKDLAAKVAARESSLAEMSLKLKELQGEKESALGKYQQLLEKQRASVPLSKACSECRIPNERIWVRPGARTSSRIQTDPGS